MAKSLFPFVCVSGVNSVDVVTAISKAIPSSFPKRHKIVVGVLTTSRTLQGLKDEHHPNRFADVQLLSKIANSAAKNKLSCIIHHRSAYEKDLLKDLTQLMRLVSGEIGGIQIDAVPNVGFIDPKILRAFKQKFPNVTLILQVGPKAFEEVKDDPDLLNKKLHTYGDSIAAVLLDKSDSRGIKLDAKELAPFVKIINQNLPECSVIVAGGLNANTMKTIAPLLKMYLHASIDAESAFFKVEKSVEVFSVENVKGYLRAFKEIQI